MSRYPGRAAMAAAWLLLLTGTIAAGPALDPSALVRVPDPRSGSNPALGLGPRAVPPVGRSWRDARFRTRLTRVTRGPDWRHEYSRFDPFNLDKSLIVLRQIHSGDWAVFQASPPYDDPARRVLTLRHIEDPRWDPKRNDVLWCLRGFTIIQYNVRTRKVTVVKDFRKDKKIAPIIKAEPDLYRVTMKNEGEPSRDMRYWALALQGKNDDYRLRYLFCWDRKQDRIVGLVKLARNESGIDWVGMSPKGTYMIIGADYNNHGRFPGLCLANRELTRFHRLAYGTAHSDVGLDTRGREVIVMQNTRTDHIDLIPLDWKTRPILVPGGSYAGTGLVKLMRLFYSNASPHGFTGGVHISCNVPGWCVVSTTQRPGRKTGNWLSRKIVLVKLDRQDPKVYYLAPVHSTHKKYWEETQATITRDGRTVVWASNWGKDVGQEKVFVMRLDLGPARKATAAPAAPAPPASTPRPPGPPGCPRSVFQAAAARAAAVLQAGGRAKLAALDRIVFCGRGRISVVSLKGTVIWHSNRRLMARNFWDKRAPGGGFSYRVLSAAAGAPGTMIGLRLPGADGAWTERCVFVRRAGMGRLPVMIIAERPGKCR